MTVAYLILAHHLPEQAARLARLIVRSSPTARVFLHYDAKSGPFDAELLAGSERITLIPDPLSIEWGDWSHVAAVQHCLNHVRTVVKIDWFTVLSGQDFPIQPICRFEKYLAKGAADAYIEAYPQSANPTARESHIVARYYYRYWKLPRLRYSHRIPRWIRNAWQGWLSSWPEGQGCFSYMWAPRGLPQRLGIRRLRVPFTREFESWQGGDWFNLSRRTVDYLFEFLAPRPEIRVTTSTPTFPANLCTTRFAVMLAIFGWSGVTCDSSFGTAWMRPRRASLRAKIWTPCASRRRSSRARSTCAPILQYSTDSRPLRSPDNWLLVASCAAQSQ